MGRIAPGTTIVDDTPEPGTIIVDEAMVIPSTDETETALPGRPETVEFSGVPG